MEAAGDVTSTATNTARLRAILPRLPPALPARRRDVTSVESRRAAATSGSRAQPLRQRRGPRKERPPPKDPPAHPPRGGGDPL